MRTLLLALLLLPLQEKKYFDPAVHEATKSFAVEDFLVVPVRVHVLRSKEDDALNARLVEKDVLRIFGKANRIWNRAGVALRIESIVDEAAVKPEGFDGATAGLDDFKRCRPEGSRADGMVHVYYVHRLPTNGVYQGRDSILVKDTAALREVKGGVDEPVPRVTSHEIGHAFTLPHRQDTINLMASGTTGWSLNDAEIERARGWASKQPWILTAKAALEAGHAAVVAGIPGESPLKEQARAALRRPAAPGDYFPPPESEGGWRKIEAAEELRSVGGMDPVKLAGLREWLLGSDKRDFAAVVIRNGHVVLEVERGNSAKTDSRRVASVSKAVCATVLAIASERSREGKTPKKMSFDDRAFDFIPWAQPLSDPRKAAITVRQLFNHTSGLCPEATGAKNDGTWDYVLGHSGDPKTEKLAFDPGTASGYSTHALCHASLVCETVTGTPYDEFAVKELFKPIGCERWWFQYYEGSFGRHPSHGMGMPARDLARIAYCMMRGGRWRDRQVIPEWFVRETAAPTHDVKTPEMRFKRAAESFSHAWELPARLGTDAVRGIPADARFKPGSGGQMIAFIPSLDLVITRQTGGSGAWEYEEYVRRACAAVLPAGK
jgi:CubicO group peptidase (beta-lactamase class C family)